MSDTLKLKAKPTIEHPTVPDHPTGRKDPVPDCCTAPGDGDSGPPKG